MDDVSGLGARGSTLWAHMKTGDPLADAVALETARAADRLDELDNIIQGKGVLELMQFRLSSDLGGDGDLTVEVKFSAPLAEAKSQQAALVSLITKYEALTAKAPGSPAVLPANVTPLDSILGRAKRA